MNNWNYKIAYKKFIETTKSELQDDWRERFDRYA